MSLFDQIRLMFSSGLHSNVAALGSFYLSICENHQDVSISPPSQYQTMVYVAKSLKKIGEYKRAEAMFLKALQFSKVVTKNKSYKSSELFKEGTTEIDVKFALSECFIAAREMRQAVSTLESIPQRHRNVQVNMALGKLYQQMGGMERPAIVAYKEVLKECPLALEAIKELLALGVLGAEISSYMINFPLNTPVTEWISTWIKGHANLHSRDYSSAICSFKNLDENSVVRKNPSVTATLGEAYYLAGDSKNALTTLQRSHSADPRNVHGVDLLACLLAKEKRVRELETFSINVTSISDSLPQPWIAVGYYCQITKRTTKAIYFAHKACTLNARSVEGLLLKGSLLLELKKFQEALMHFREAMQIAPHRFEPHKGLVDCYIAMHRLRDAASFAGNTCKILGQTPRTLTLYASVLSKDSVTVSKAKSYLEKALKKDPYYLPAVYQYCDILAHDMRYETAIELLQKQVSVQSTYKLHQTLADFHSYLQQEEKADHHYSIAMNFTQEGSGPRPLTDVPRGEGRPEPGLDMDMEEIGDSEGDIEESDLEVVWADADISFSGN